MNDRISLPRSSKEIYYRIPNRFLFFTVVVLNNPLKEYGPKIERPESNYQYLVIRRIYYFK